MNDVLNNLKSAWNIVDSADETLFVDAQSVKDAIFDACEALLKYDKEQIIHCKDCAYCKMRLPSTAMSVDDALPYCTNKRMSRYVEENFYCGCAMKKSKTK